jgi:hypothetical protein
MVDDASDDVLPFVEGRQVPSDSDLAMRSMELMSASAEPFENERHRNEQILKLLQPILGADFVKSELITPRSRTARASSRREGARV